MEVKNLDLVLTTMDGENAKTTELDQKSVIISFIQLQEVLSQKDIEKARKIVGDAMRVIDEVKDFSVRKAMIQGIRAAVKIKKLENVDRVYFWGQKCLELTKGCKSIELSDTDLTELEGFMSDVYKQDLDIFMFLKQWLIEIRNNKIKKKK